MCFSITMVFTVLYSKVVIIITEKLGIIKKIQRGDILCKVAADYNNIYSNIYSFWLDKNEIKIHQNTQQKSKWVRMTK